MTAELRQAARAFAQAVDMAARGGGDAQERLVTAYKRYLVTLHPASLPQPLRERFLALHERVCGQPPGGPSEAYTATFRAMNSELAADLLTQLVELKNALRLLLEEHEA